MGNKLPWTLADEENWNQTHQFAGRLYATVGILCIVNAFLQADWLLIPIIIAIIVLPILYSLGIYLKKRS